MWLSLDCFIGCQHKFDLVANKCLLITKSYCFDVPSCRNTSQLFTLSAVIICIQKRNHVVLLLNRAMEKLVLTQSRALIKRG